MSSSAETASGRVTERVFDVPRPYRKAAAAWLERGADIHASAPRPAGAVVFVRDGERGVETLMMHRPGRRSMGMLFFPGGHVEPADDDPLGPGGVADVDDTVPVPDGAADSPDPPSGGLVQAAVTTSRAAAPATPARRGRRGTRVGGIPHCH